MVLQTIYGVLTQDLLRENARTLARRDTDFIFIDMEHSPLNIDALANFVAASNDKAYTLKNGAQPRSAILVRMPPYASEHASWVVKQALDIGVMGFVFNTVETKEQAEAAVKSMADLWPLNPEGDLMAIMIIETQTGIRNVGAIAQVPGVTVLSAAAGGDLSSSYGVPGNAPEIEAARQAVLQACLKHRLVCWISPSGKADQDRRLQEGWRMIRTADGRPF